MADVTVVKYSYEGEKFEILVKPDPALEYKLGKNKDISSVLVSDDIYTDSSKGTKPSMEKLLKAFNTDDSAEIAKKILEKFCCVSIFFLKVHKIPYILSKFHQFWDNFLGCTQN